MTNLTCGHIFSNSYCTTYILRVFFTKSIFVTKSLSFLFSSAYPNEFFLFYFKE